MLVRSVLISNLYSRDTKWESKFCCRPLPCSRGGATCDLSGDKQKHQNQMFTTIFSLWRINPGTVFNHRWKHQQNIMDICCPVDYHQRVGCRYHFFFPLWIWRSTSTIQWNCCFAHQKMIESGKQDKIYRRKTKQRKQKEEYCIIETKHWHVWVQALAYVNY